MFRNIYTRGQVKHSRNPNKRTVDIDKETRLVYEFDMESIRYLYEFYKGTVYGDSSRDIFFGIVFSQFPRLEISGLAVKDSNDFFKKVFYEFFVPFLEEWWVSFHSVGFHFYYFLYIPEYNIYVPKSVDIYQGKAFCLYDFDKTGEQKMVWQHNEPFIIDRKQSSQIITYDPNVLCLKPTRLQFPEHPDNIMQWVWAINSISNGDRWMMPNRRPIHPYNSALSKCLDIHFRMEQLRSNEIKTERLLGTIHMVQTNKLDYHNETYGNFIETYGKSMGDTEALKRNVQFREMFNLNKKNKTLNQMQPQMAMLNQQSRNLVSNQAQMEQAELNNSPYATNNPPIENIRNLGTYLGSDQLDDKDMSDALFNAASDNIGVTTDAIRRGDFTHVIVDPTKNVSFPTKQSGKDLSKHEENYAEQLTNAFCGLMDHGGNSKDSAENLKLRFKKAKPRVLALMRTMETTLNTIYKDLMDTDIQILRTFFKQLGVALPTVDYLEFKFHFQTTFELDIDDFVKLYKEGIFDGEFVQNVALQQFGMHDVRETMKGAKSHLIPKPPIDLRPRPLDPNKEQPKTGSKPKASKSDKSEKSDKSKKDSEKRKRDDDDDKKPKKKDKVEKKKEVSDTDDDVVDVKEKKKKKEEKVVDVKK